MSPSAPSPAAPELRTDRGRSDRIPPYSEEAERGVLGAILLDAERVLDLALASRCRIAVLPCCHDLRQCDTGALGGWMDGPLAVDATRVARLRAAGYRVQTSHIPAEITPKNRLLLGWPDETAPRRPTSP